MDTRCWTTIWATQTKTHQNCMQPWGSFKYETKLLTWNFSCQRKYRRGFSQKSLSKTHPWLVQWFGDASHSANDSRLGSGTGVVWVAVCPTSLGVGISLEIRRMFLFRGVFLVDIPSCFHSNNSKGLHRPVSSCVSPRVGVDSFKWQDSESWRNIYICSPPPWSTGGVTIYIYMFFPICEIGICHILYLHTWIASCLLGVD